MLDPQALETLIRNGGVDTVLVAFPDLQGRLIGKRVTGHFFLDHVARGEGAIEACDYLLARRRRHDPAARLRVRELGVGLRRLPLRARPGDAAHASRGSRRPRSSCATSSTRRPASRSRCRPARSCIRQVERAAALGLPREVARRSSSSSSSRSRYEEAQAKRVPGPHAALRTSSRTTTSSRRPATSTSSARSATAWTTRASRSSSRRARPGKGQHEINLRYADAVEMADRHVIYKNGAKEIAGLNGRSLTFMAKYSMDDVGSSCHVHSSLWDARGHRVASCGSDDGPDHMSPAFRGWLGGLVATGRELAWMFAPTVNSLQAVPAGVVGADRARLGPRQPHLRLPARRPRPGLPHRVAHPRRRREPVPRVRGDDRGRPARHREQDRAAADARGQRVRRARHPARPVEHRRRDRRVRAQRGRATRRSATAVHHHLVHTATPGVGRVQPGRHGLGAPPQLRADSERWPPKPLIAVPAYPVRSGRIEGWVDAGVAVPEPYVAALKRAGAQEAVLMPEAIDRRRRRATCSTTSTALLLLGGGDLDPATYGAEPDAHIYGMSHAARRVRARARARRDRPRPADARDLSRRAGAERRARRHRSTSTSPVAPGSSATAPRRRGRRRRSTTSTIDAGSRLGEAMGATDGRVLVAPPPGDRPTRRRACG